MYNSNLLRPLAVFLAVARLASFRKAALDLGISAPLASQIVAALEERLGQQLLYRSTRKVTLTDAGTDMVQQLSAPFDQIDGVLDEFASRLTAPKGRLRVTVPTILAQPAFARFVHGYVTAHPQLHLDIDLSDAFVDPLKTGHDLAIRIGRADGGDRVLRRLFQSEGIICAAAQGREWTLADLSTQLFIRPPEMVDHLTLFRGTAQHKITPTQVLVVNHGGMVRDLLKHGGYGVFPAFCVREAIAKGELLRVLPEWSLGKLDISALYTARRARLSLARHFVTDLVAFLNRV